MRSWDSARKKPKVFSILQEAIGHLRHNLDAICEYAATMKPSAARDQVLVDAVKERCRRELLIGDEIEAAAIGAAVHRVRDRALQLMRAEPDLCEDWLKALGERPSTSFTAGEILAEIGDLVPGVRLPWGRSSMAKFAATLQGPDAYKQQARRVHEGERLTFLATALGIPVTLAPAVAFRMTCLVEGYRPKSEWKDMSPRRRPPPGTLVQPQRYRLAEWARWLTIIRNMEEAFMAEGLWVGETPEGPNVGPTLQRFYPVRGSHRVVRDICELSPALFWAERAEASMAPTVDRDGKGKL